MKLSKKFLISTILITACAFTFAQTSQVESTSTYEEEEASAESDYLNDMIGESISAMAESNDYEVKLSAVIAVRDAISKGNRSQAVIDSLDRLAGEGITSEVRKGGRKINNFPDIRREACFILAEVPTAHSKNTLIRIAKEDIEPSVGGAAIQSLSKIAKEIDCVDEAVDAIHHFQKKNYYLNPMGSFAHEVIYAYERLIDSASPKQRRDMIEDIAKIAGNSNYPNRALTMKAQEMMMKYAGVDSDSDSSDDEVSVNSK